MKDNLLPLTFRSAELARIFSTLAAGDSLQIIGIGSVGKSNLNRFLLQPDVRQRYLGPEWERYLFIYIDANKLLKLNEWGLYELLIHQTRLEMAAREVDEGLLARVEELHRRAASPETQHLALRDLDNLLLILCKTLGLSVVFLFDEFDDLARLLPVQAFDALRACRDEHKYHLMYVLSARSPLGSLRKDPSEIESFNELVSDHIFWLSAYSADDARLMIARLAARYRMDLDEDTFRGMIRLTGGHPGLIRGTFRAVCEQSHPLDESLAEQPILQEECLQIWRSLPSDEQQALAGLAADPPQTPAPEMARWLAQKGLLNEDKIFSALLERHIHNGTMLSGPQIVVDYEAKTVSVEGRPGVKLGRLEFLCLTYLDKHRNEVCSRDEIGDFIYASEKQKAVKRIAVETFVPSNDMIDSVIKRLRQAVEKDPAHPRYVITARGFGYRLDDVAE